MVELLKYLKLSLFACNMSFVFHPQAENLKWKEVAFLSVKNELWQEKLRKNSV